MRDAFARFDSSGSREELDRFDSQRAAVAMGTVCGGQRSSPVDGSWVLGPASGPGSRTKTELGALLATAAVPSARELTVPAVEAALLEAASDLDAGMGTVWWNISILELIQSD